MTWTNYHSHTYYCDGGEKPVEYVRAAIEKGIAAYGFSSHGPVPFESNWNIKQDDLPGYVREVENLKHTHKKQLDVYLGFEVDYIPQKMGPKNPLLTSFNLDYTIGSIHYVDEFPDGLAWHIDGHHEDYLNGLKKIFHNNIQKAVSRYYELTMEMLETEKPTILGHLDKMKMQNINNKLFNEQDSWYRSLIDKLIDTIKKSDVIVEINTRGYYKKKEREFYPSHWIIEKLAENNIPITLNSDAHLPKEITNGFIDAVFALQELGVQELFALIDHQWQAFKYNDHGLILP